MEPVAQGQDLVIGFAFRYLVGEWHEEDPSMEALPGWSKDDPSPSL